MRKQGQPFSTLNQNKQTWVFYLKQAIANLPRNRDWYILREHFKHYLFNSSGWFIKPLYFASLENYYFNCGFFFPFSLATDTLKKNISTAQIDVCIDNIWLFSNKGVAWWILHCRSIIFRRLEFWGILLISSLKIF